MRGGWAGRSLCKRLLSPSLQMRKLIPRDLNCKSLEVAQPGVPFGPRPACASWK